MENLNLTLLGLALLGLFIHVLMKIVNRSNKKTTKFSFKVFFSDSMNWVRIVLSIASIFALLLMSEEIGNMIGITLTDGSPAPKVFAFGAGYFNHSIIRNVLKSFKKGEENGDS